MRGDVPADLFSEEITQQTLESIRVMQQVQQTNKERGCNRYIISNCQSLENILELFAMFRLSNWENPTVDLIPLFETIPDLEAAEEVMRGSVQRPNLQSAFETTKNEANHHAWFFRWYQGRGLFYGKLEYLPCQRTIE